MKKYVSLDKRSKKAKKEYYSKMRSTWGEFDTVTRSEKSAKTYDRKKEKQKMRKLSDQSGYGYDAELLFCLS